MDCSVCNFRCAQCHVLLCEVCGVTCEGCGKMVCPEHFHETSRGSKLCQVCYEERKARRRASAKAARAASGELGAEESPQGIPEEEAEEEEAPVGREPPRPWKLSLYAASTAAVLILIMLLLPGLRRFALPGGGYFPTPYAIFLVLAFAVFWAVVGLVKEEDYYERRRSFIGLGIALVTCVLVFLAVYTDPARLAEIEARRIQSMRDRMTPDQLKQWREQRLKRFNP